MFLGALYLGVWAWAPWARSLRDTVLGAASLLRLPSGPTEAVQILGVALALVTPWWVLSLPLDVYSSYRLPHRFGLSNQTPAGWITDQLKGLAVGALLGGPLLLALYALMESGGGAWWVWASAGYAGVTVVLTTLGPVLLMPIFYRLKPLGEPHLALRERLMELAESAGVRVQSVDTIDMSRRTKAANAMVVGLGRTRRIVVGDTLLDSFEPDEAETVLAHELGHQAHRDVATGILIQSAAVVLVFAGVDAVLRLAVRSGRIDRLADPAGWPLLVLTWSLLSFLESPLLHLYSRWREGRADAFALRLSRKPEAFMRSMVRLGDQNLAEAVPPRWAVFLFGTHPSLAQRVERARRAAETD